MPENIIKPAGATKASKNDAGGGVLRSEPVIAIVKNNIDPVRQGRLQVWIEDLNGTDADDSSGWVTVSYMSPFYGKTYGSAPDNGFGEYSTNSVSYGEWHAPPDVGTRVICIFVNGDPNYGYYIGCVPEPESLTMVPAIGASVGKVILNKGESKNLAGATQLPVTNLNDEDTSLAESNDFLNAPKPVHSYVASTMAQQGLIRDTIRGPITSSAQRETPSRVGWGVSTPGRPIYEGGVSEATVLDTAESNPAGTKIVSRRAGHTFVMDDGDILGKDQLIRLRSSLGHQILMSDDGQCLFIIHANGQSWIELGKEGTIDMYATNSVNIRTQGDLNLHADNNLNIQANKNINIKAKENININADQDYSLRVAANHKEHTVGNHAVKVSGQMSMQSAGDASYASSGSTFINGSKVNLNTGSSSLTPSDINPIPMFTHTDTLFDAEKGFIPAPGTLQTIASRAPAHHPWINANQGVDVKTNLNATAALPAEPAPPVAKTNATVPATPPAPVSTPVVATVPGNEQASKNIDVGTTSALVSATAVTAATTSPTAVSAGAAIANGQAAVGQLAQTAQQLVTGGTLKPGSERLINGLVSAGATVQGAMTSNMFAGAPGAENLQSFVNNTTAQVTNVVNTIKTVEKQLTNTGLITGKESPTAIGGVVLSGVQNGITQTVDFVKNVGSNVTEAAKQLAGAAGKVADSISSGNFASNLSTNINGALGGITNTLGGLVDKVKDPAVAAFESIKDAYKSFKPNVPQDLTALAEQNAGESPAAEEPDPYEGLTPEQLKALGSADPTDPFIRSRLGLPPLGGGQTGTISLTGATSGTALGGITAGLPTSLSGVTSLVNNAVTSTTNDIKNLDLAKTGLQGLPGGQAAVSMVVNNATGALQAIPGAAQLGGVINNNVSAALAGASQQVMAEAASIGKTLGGVTAGLPSGSDLTASLSDLQNKLKQGSESLVAMASSVLPKGLAAELNSAVNAIAASSPDKLKIPVVATNTVNRGEITSQVSSIISNPKIPAPSYTDGIQQYLKDEQAKLDAQKEKQKENQKRFDAQYAITAASKKEWLDAANNAPEGDPVVAELKQKFIDEYGKLIDIAAENARS